MSTSTERTDTPQNASSEAPRFLPLETVSVRLHGTLSLCGQTVFGILANVSETGACIITNLPVATGERVSLELESPRWTDTIDVEAIVVWSAERMEPVKEIVGFLTGLRFEAKATGTIRERLKSGIFQLIP